MINTNQEIVRLEHIWVRYDGTYVLEDVSLSIRRGDFLGIIGPNGGGKTTLLKVMLGLLQPTQGQVVYPGHALDEGRKMVGYVSQHNLFDRDFPASAWDVAIMGRAKGTGLFKRYTKTDKDATAKSLHTVGMLNLADRQMGRLSGGEQQRIFIARALATEPQLLLLDEPTASVDTTTQTEFYELLERLKEDISIVIVSHDLSAISIYVDKIACLNVQLHYHGSTEIAPEVLEATYKCPVQMIAHGHVPHRVLKEH